MSQLAVLKLHAGACQEGSALSRLEEEDLSMGEVLSRMSGYLVAAFLNLFVTSSAFPGGPPCAYSHLAG